MIKIAPISYDDLNKHIEVHVDELQIDLFAVKNTIDKKE